MQLVSVKGVEGDVLRGSLVAARGPWSGPREAVPRGLSYCPPVQRPVLRTLLSKDILIHVLRGPDDKRAMYSAPKGNGEMSRRREEREGSGVGGSGGGC